MSASRTNTDALIEAICLNPVRVGKRELSEAERVRELQRQLAAVRSEQQQIVTMTEVVCGPDNKPASGYCAINGCAVMSGAAKLSERPD